MKKVQDITPKILAELLSDEQISQPVTDAEIAATEAALVAFAQLHAVAAPLSMRDKIFGKMQKLNAEKHNRQLISIDNPPLLTKDSNWLDWAEAAKDIAEPTDLENIHLHPIREDAQVEMFVAYVREFIEEEVHHDLLESFILLEGTCECHITREDGSKYTVRMQAGDHIEMQLGEQHDVVITSLKPAKAILQWLKLAA